MIKIYVFPKNTPWGIEKKYDGSNIYKNVINFVDNNNNFDSSLRDDYINRNLMPGQETWKQALRQQEYTNYQPIDELKFKFIASPKTQKDFLNINTLMNSDYAVVYDEKADPGAPQDIYKFYALSVEKVDKGQVHFIASLDIFMTYNIDKNMFIDKAQSFVVKSHMKRYKNNGDIKWDNVLRNKIDLTPVKENRNLPINWVPWLKGINVSDLQVYKEIKYAIFYVKLQQVGKTVFNNIIKSTDIFSDTNPETKINGVISPVLVVIIPYHPSLPIYTKKSQNRSNTSAKSLHITRNQIKALLKDNGASMYEVPSISLLGITPLNFIYLTENSSNSKEITGLQIDTSQNLEGVGRFYDTNNAYRYLFINEFKKLQNIEGEVDFSFDKTVDPIIYHPAIYKLRLKHWEQNEKNDNGAPFVKIENGKIKIKGNYLFSATESQSIFNIEKNDLLQKTQMINGDYYTISNDDMLPSTQTKLAEYLRDNKNTFNTRKYYDRVGSGVNIASGLLGLAGGIAGKSAITSAGSGFGVANSVLTLFRNDDMRESQIADLKNQLPEIVMGNTVNANVIMNKRYPGIDDLQLLEITLLDYEKEKLLNRIKMEGYDVGENREVSNLINNRKVFNYFQGINVFSIIKYKLSARIKQEIGMAFSNGITVWHYRQAGQKLVIQDYDVDNGEV